MLRSDWLPSKGALFTTVFKENISDHSDLNDVSLDEESQFVENLPVSNEWEKGRLPGKLEAAAITDICIYFSGSEKIHFYLFLYI